MSLWNSRRLRPMFVGVVWLMSFAACAAEAPFPGQRSTWNGFDRYDFESEGRAALVVVPRSPAAGRPWVWHGEFFGHRPVPDVALLGRGFHIVYLQVPNLFGAPPAVAHWNALYQTLTQQHGLAPKVALVGISRGGLYCYNWAAENPACVACIYGDAPVCDVRSWPAGQGQGDGNAVELERLMQVYDAQTEDELFARATNPIDHLAPLAEARVPLLHVYGDADTGVPWEENTGVLAERYRALGGEITLIAKPGVGHVHGLEDSSPIIEFIEQHSLSANRPSAGPPLELGTRRELFVDRYLIDRLTNAELTLHEPRDEGRVLAFDQPWEGPFAGYSTILRDGDRFLLYYRGISEKGLDGSEHERTCLAESSDGRAWTKPPLGLYEFAGSTANNIVLADAAPVTHNFCPFLDARPGVSADERFKAVGGTGHELFAYVSADGRAWRKLRETPILSSSDVPIPHTHLFDSQNLAFWSESEQQYVCYFRVWDGLRRIARTTSMDFQSWTPAVLMRQLHDDGRSGPQPAPAEHLYTNQTSPYFRAPHLYVAIAARFFEGRQVVAPAEAAALGVDPQYFSDTSDAVFLTTRGGDVYDRTFLQGYLKPGIGLSNWVSRTNYPALNVVQTGPTEMSLYVNHDYAQATSHLRRYSLRLDGFASVQAGATPGELLTKPFTFTGARLTINFATSAAGSLRFELQDAQGHPLPGYTLAECREQIGNEIERTVTWEQHADVAALAGQVVRLRCVLQDADLYALQFVADE